MFQSVRTNRTVVFSVSITFSASLPSTASQHLVSQFAQDIAQDHAHGLGIVYNQYFGHLDPLSSLGQSARNNVLYSGLEVADWSNQEYLRG